jgi:hypothetical protein
MLERKLRSFLASSAKIKMPIGVKAMMVVATDPFKIGQQPV